MTTDRAIAALGNPYRQDDGVGPAVLKRLADRKLPAVDCLDLGDAGFDLVHVTADYERVVVVDAVDFGGEPGEVTVFDPTEPDGTAGGRGTHGTDLFELLSVATRLDREPPAVRIVGVQPAETGFGEELSPAVSRTLPTVVETVIETVRSR